jgi:hypothetical protein
MRVLADRLHADLACPLTLGPFLLTRELSRASARKYACGKFEPVPRDRRDWYD